MILSGILLLVCCAISHCYPVPSARYLRNGDLEILLEDVSGYLSVHISYSVHKHRYIGQFHKRADEKWVHLNSEEKTEPGPIEYNLTCYTQNGMITNEGRIYPDHKSLSITPHKHVRRGTVVFRDDFSGALDNTKWKYEVSMYDRRSLSIAPPRHVRRGTVVFRDDFSGALDTSKWEYEVSMYGGYNGEIQVYTNDPQNIYTRNGKLFIKPTITNNDPRFSGNFLNTGIMDMNQLFGYCTNSDREGCRREGKDGLLPPVMSGKLKSKPTVRFGKVEVRAKVPIGDWLWPAIWMLPKSSKYGTWPRSGEIDLMECRGNTYAGAGGQDHGIRQTGATLHWGTDFNHNRFGMTHGEKRQGNPWSDAFHTWTLYWTHDHIQVMIDGQNVMWIQVPGESFFNWGHLPGNNIWAGGEKSAPFDQAFYLILNVAVGGTSGYFPDSFNYNSPKPWKNNSPNVNQDFWNARGSWMPSWKGDDVAMQIDYVEMTQY